MASRRKFISTASIGLLGATALPGSAIFGAGNFAGEEQQKKNIVVGIIGAENNHTVGYGKLFNIEKKFPGVELKYVWGETGAFAKRAQDEGAIPYIVKDPREMLGKIDALIVDHRHPKYHLPAAMPFLEEKIPMFIDKPFCYRAEEGKAFLQRAKALKVPVSSYSSIAQTNATFDIREQVKEMNDIEQIVRYGVLYMGMNNNYGGIFYYGVHTVQPLMYIFGEDIAEVKITEKGGKWSGSLAFGSGLMATLVFTEEYHGWNTFVVEKDGIKELKSRVPASDPPRNYVDMVKMFRTGEMPRTFQSILNSVSVLEALERSVHSRKWEKVNYLDV